MFNISVIVPIYKGNCYLQKIISMIEQNWEYANQDDKVNMELIFVNDFPQEKLSYNTEWGVNIKIIELSNEVNRGIHFSRVNGFVNSTGEYVLFLDQDDEISPLFIKEQLRAIGNLDAVICNGKFRSDYIYKNQRNLDLAVDKEIYFNKYNGIVSPGQVLIKRDAIPHEWLNNIMNKNGADDYFLWILMLKKGFKIGIQDRILYWHQTTDSNTSSNLEKMDESVCEMLEKLKRMDFLTRSEDMNIRNNTLSLNIRNSCGTVKWELYRKEQTYKAMLNLWLTLRERGVSVDKFLKSKGIFNVVIYGYGMFGKHLYHELRESDINVKYIMDKSDDIFLNDVKKVTMGDDIENVDAIIVTPFMEMEQIKKDLQRYYQCKIVSIRTILMNADFELLNAETT